MTWISVKEKLPDWNELVFICGVFKYDNDKEYRVFTDVGSIDSDDNWYMENDWYEGQEYFEILFCKPIEWPEEPDKLTILERIKLDNIQDDFV